MKINLTTYRYLFATIIIPMGYHLPTYITSLYTTSLPCMQQTLPTPLHLLTFLHRSLEMKLHEKLTNVSLFELVVSYTVCYRNVFGELLSFSSILQKTPGYNTIAKNAAKSITVICRTGLLPRIDQAYRISKTRN